MLVNIQARVILDLAGQGLLAYLGTGGWFVGSGMLESQADDVLVALGDKGLCEVEIRREGDWVALVGRMV